LDHVLKQFVTEQGRVDYTALQADPRELDRYVTEHAAVSPTSDPPVSWDQLSCFGPADLYLNTIPTVKMQGGPTHTMTTIAEQFAFVSLGVTFGFS
jgi:hypothetical protein